MLSITCINKGRALLNAVVKWYICKNTIYIQKKEWIGYRQDVLGYARICQDMSGIAWICLNIPGCDGHKRITPGLRCTTIVMKEPLDGYGWRMSLYQPTGNQSRDNGFSHPLSSQASISCTLASHFQESLIVFLAVAINNNNRNPLGKSRKPQQNPIKTLINQS